MSEELITKLLAAHETDIETLQQGLADCRKEILAAAVAVNKLQSAIAKIFKHIGHSSTFDQIIKQDQLDNVVSQLESQPKASLGE